MRKKVYIVIFLISFCITVSCKKSSSNLVLTDINTVYWDFSKASTNASTTGTIIVGEVGNNRGIDSLSITVSDLTQGRTLLTFTMKKSDLIQETRQDFSISVTKWYMVKYTPKTPFLSKHSISFNLTAYTPFGLGQDLRSKDSPSVLIN